MNKKYLEELPDIDDHKQDHTQSEVEYFLRNTLFLFKSMNGIRLFGVLSFSIESVVITSMNDQFILLYKTTRLYHVLSWID